MKAIVVLSFPFFIHLTACSNDDEASKRGKGGSGFVSLDLRTDTAYAETKAASDPKNVNDYKVQIMQGADVVTSFRFGDKPEKLTLDVGDYVAKATWGTLVPAGFDSLYMEGSTNFSIKEELTTNIKITSTPANAKVLVKYADSLKLAYSDYSISMSTSHTGNAPLVYGKNETRPAYFIANQSGESLNLDLFFKAGSKDYNYKNSVKIKPRDFVTLSVKLGQEAPDTKPDPTIKTDISSYEFPADGAVYKDILVSSNCPDWTVTKSADWVLIERSSNKITVTAKPNTTDKIRIASLTLTAVSGNKTAVAVVTIVQNTKNAGGVGEPYIIPIPKSMAAEEFKDSKVTIRTNDANWKYKQDEESKTWLTIKRGEGTDVNSLSATSLSLNADSKVARIATIALEAIAADKTAKDTIYITQDVKYVTPVIRVKIGEEAVTSIDFPSEGKSEQVTVESNVEDWTVSVPDADKAWLTVEKSETGLKLTAAGNTESKSRNTIVTLNAVSGNLSATYPLIVTQNVGTPKITLTITINTEIVKDTVLTEGYEVDKPIADPVSIKSAGFQPEGSITVEKGNARSYLVSLKATKGIQTCTLSEGQQKYELNTSPPDGLIYSPNEANTLVTIYLDEYLNKLAPGFHICNLSVIGKENTGTASIRFYVNVE